MGWQALLGQGISDTANMAYNWAYTDYWTRHAEQREDNAMQRHVADLQNAGLSATLGAGGQGHASAPVVSDNKNISNYGDLIARNASLDIAKREQDNKDAIAQAQVDNLNAQSDLLRERIPHETAEAGLSQSNLSSYDQRLAAEMADNASRIEHRSQQILQSQQEIRNLQEGVKSHQQSRAESESRIRLNSRQIELANQAISRGEYTINLLRQELENARRTGNLMDIEAKQKQMNAISESVRQLYEMREGNFHHSLIGKIVTDLMETWKRTPNQTSSVRNYMDIYNQLLNDISR